MAGTRPKFDAFLSYARADDPGFRDAVLAGLVDKGFRVWFDRESLPNRGMTFDQEIRRAIESSARLLLVVGPAALASEYVAQEWGFADDFGLPVIPVLRSTAFDQLPERLRSYNAVDARPPTTTDAVVTELIRLLTEPVLPLGTCYGVPPRPPHELPRPELIERLALVLGLDRQRPEEAGRAPRVAAVYGTSGVGKSTVAAVFARSIRSRRAFPDGIAWISCGPSFRPLASARELLGQVAIGAKLPGTEDEVASALAEGLGEREVLLVLDDARDADAVAPFVGALGPGGRAVVTTLDQAVATALGAVDIAVHQLDDASARQLLEEAAGGPLPPEADEVVAACDGLPFALAIVGAMVRNRVPWERVVQALEERRLDLLEARFPGYPHPNLLRALSASYDALATDDPRSAECFLELAAFRPGATLTESVMTRLWSRPGRLSPLDAGFVLPVLERRLLVLRRPASDGDRFELHGLHEDFVRLECPNVAELEAALVETYRVEKGAAAWSTLPDDGYVYDHLVAHLASLGERTELASAVDADWARRQLLRRGDLGQTVDDVRLALDSAAAPPLDLVTVVRLSLLSGQVAATLREAPPSLVAAMAVVGDIDQALRWAADKPDPAERFEALVGVTGALIRREEPALARKVVRTAAATIPLLGGVVETGMFSGLTALNAVHALVDFPAPDEWEGTTPDLVALASVPLDAVVRLAPLAAQVGAVAELSSIGHPFWELYGHLIPLVAVERLADGGDPDAAAALYDAIAEDSGFDDDRADAADYRRAVAAAALGRFDEARGAVEALPDQYQAVGYRGLARHLAAAGPADDALALLALIVDETVADAALSDVVEATLERADPAGCRMVAQFALDRDWAVAAAWLLAAGGDPSLGLDLLGRSPRDDLSLGLGVRLTDILDRRGQRQEAAAIVRRLVPVAVRLLGPQWFAPETINAAPELASLGSGLLASLARTGEPLPDGVSPLALIVEAHYGRLAAFKLPLLVHLTMAGRFAEARELAGTSAVPYGRALSLATVLSVADQPVSVEECQTAASNLVEALDGVAADATLDLALGGAMRALMSAGLSDEAEALVERLLPRPGLWSALGNWALERARAGQPRDVRELVKRLLVERPLQAPGARARAMLLCAVAARHAEPGEELEATTALLADLAVAAAALDVVFDLVDLYARRQGLDAAGSFARNVAAGEAATLAEELFAGKSIQWDSGPSEQDLAAATAVRAVASAGMALAAGRSGARPEADTWLKRADALARQVEGLASYTDVPATIGKYVDVARASVDEAPALDDPGAILAIAWLLWDSGCETEAAEYAAQALTAMPSDAFTPEAGGQRIMTVEDLERRSGVVGAARAALGAIVAMDAAARGDLAEASEAARVAVDQKGYGWLALRPAERSEIGAALAIALHRAGVGDAALEQLETAVEPAVTLAARGELAPFRRLCQALIEVLGSDRAAPIWAEWLRAASGAGASEALGLLAPFIRYLPDADVRSLAVDAETGQLHSRAS